MNFLFDTFKFVVVPTKTSVKQKSVTEGHYTMWDDDSEVNIVQTPKI